MLLRALGYSTNADIFRAFGCIEDIKIRSKNVSQAIGCTVVEDIIDTLRDTVCSQVIVNLMKYKKEF